MQTVPSDLTVEKYDPFEGETIVAENISYEEFLRVFDGRHAEWYQGKVILVMANSLRHQVILKILSVLLFIYFDKMRVGNYILAPFSTVTGDDAPRREPDIIIVLNEHRDRVKSTFLEGAPDIAVEIVSPESIDRDYGDKFDEYARAGVREYWIIDPGRQIVDVHLLDDEANYHRAPLDEKGSLVSSLLPNFRLDPAIFWRDEEPSTQELIQLVEKMTE